MTIFGSYLDRYLQDHKIKRKAFASILGVPVREVQSWITGDGNPKGFHLIRIASVINVGVDVLEDMVRKDDEARRNKQNLERRELLYLVRKLPGNRVPFWCMVLKADLQQMAQADPADGEEG